MLGRFLAILSALALVLHGGGAAFAAPIVSAEAGGAWCGQALSPEAEKGIAEALAAAGLTAGKPAEDPHDGSGALCAMHCTPLAADTAAQPVRIGLRIAPAAHAGWSPARSRAPRASVGSGPRSTRGPPSV
jgi:hypothetical protein